MVASAELRFYWQRSEDVKSPKPQQRAFILDSRVIAYPYFEVATFPYNRS